jgi:hypothetical protein
MTAPTTRYLHALMLCASLLAGCAGLTTKMDPPRVSLDSFASLPGEGGGPRFEIKLRVQNPNEQSLDIAGISYTIALMGNEVMSGVSNDVPKIDGYSEEVVTLQASLQLFQLLRLFAQMGQSPAEELDYRFAAKIDFRGLVPTQRVEETGRIALR